MAFDTGYSPKDSVVVRARRAIARIPDGAGMALVLTTVFGILPMVAIFALWYRG